MEDRYYSYSQHLQKKHGSKIYKVVVSSGLTCPTRDGTLAKRGCAFCDVRGSSSFNGKIGRGKEITEQIDARLPKISARYNADKFFAYFQSYTNTYSDVGYLRAIYEEALSHPNICGLSVGTRPDCLPVPVLELMQELAEKYPVCVELGVQSLHNPTLEWLVRGHDAQCSIDAIQRSKTIAPNVEVSAHLMFGNPTDEPDTARKTALALNELPLDGVKLHQLMVLENTDLATRYREQPFATATLLDYTATVSDFLNHLRPDIYVERLYAKATHPDELLAPAWSANMWDTHNKMRDELDRLNCLQGSALLNYSSGSKTSLQGSVTLTNP